MTAVRPGNPHREEPLSQADSAPTDSKAAAPR
jgi:hypothetical protein